jgi:protein-L-isoaspartate(D-aspartate) O-methyltransferase
VLAAGLFALPAFAADPRIDRAFAEVHREDFLPDAQKPHAGEDHPLPIGEGQTTSQPSLIGQMIELMHLPKDCRVLEIGTGSGFQTALLAKICPEVYSVEIVPSLAATAAKRLAALGFKNASVKAGDGYAGWAEHAPFDGIVVSAGAAKVPAPLLKQLKPSGRLVIPIGKPDEMTLWVVTADGKIERSIPVRFVPLTGDSAEKDRAAPAR